MFKKNDNVISELRRQIADLQKEKQQLLDRLMCLLDTDNYKTYKMFQDYKRAEYLSAPRKPQKYDDNAKKFRDMTDEEINRDLAGLRELGIIA